MSNLVVGTLPITVGAAVIDGAPSTTELWAQGPTIPPDFSGQTAFSAAGPDLDARDLLGMTSQPLNGEPDLFTNHLGGKSAFQIWSTALGATARRLTYAEGGTTSFGAYELDPAKFRRTASTPAAGQWVRYIVPTRTYAFVLAVTFASDCALGAMSDLIGARPIVLNGFKNAGNTILDPDKRPMIQELLVRDGTEVMLSVVSLRHDPIADDVLATTTCGPMDLAACAAAIDRLEGGGKPVSSDLPPAAALQTATDPAWSVVSYETANVTMLLP